MSKLKYPGFDTISLHGGQRPDPVTGARAAPIYQTTSFVFRETDQASSMFDLARSGHVYSRISNPTVAVLEERIAGLEGGTGAVATASGMAAIHLALCTLMDGGSHIVSSHALYGGTHNLFTYTLPRFGINTTFVDPREPDAFKRAIRPETRLIYAETIGNPRCEILDIETIAGIAHDAQIPLMLDSTLTTPYLLKPFDHGADIVIHSLTKFIGGHGVAIGGLVVDSGRFDWDASDKFKTLTEPYAGILNIDFAEDFGPDAFLHRARREGLRDFGAALSPANAFYILQGVETLALRMDKHVANTRKIVACLDNNEAVEYVTYPELPAHQDYELAKKLLPKGCGSVFSFELKGGRETGRKFIEALKVFSHLANVGDAKSLVIHPASTTHSRMDDDALTQAGITQGLVRLSVGLEDPGDLINDLDRALYRSQK